MRIALVLAMFLAAAAAPARGDEALCLQPESWLPGTWQVAEKTHVTIALDAEGFGFVYRREAGQMTTRWGEKAAAMVEGRVTAIDGCAIELDGVYTAYDALPGSKSSGFGERMFHRMRYDGTAVLVGQGIGHGRSWFPARWRRQ